MIPVHFFYPYPDELVQLNELRLDDWRPWSDPRYSRRRAWIVQTYLRLLESGHPVSITPSLPDDGIVVLLPDRYMRSRFLRAEPHRNPSLFVVTIRADVRGYREFFADAEIVQNGRFADRDGAFFIPHWPQPGIIPRQSSRGDTLDTVAFKGRVGSLLEGFQSDSWRHELDALGVEFVVDAPHNGSLPDWHDYSDVDLVLAVREDFSDGSHRADKPASKLVNAWHAGVPALLGPEHAFRELRQSDLDFVEVQSPDDAVAAIARLKRDHYRYRAMRDHCRMRAADLTPERITGRWAEVLFEELPRIIRQRRIRQSSLVSPRVRRVINLVAAPPSPLELRKMIGEALRSSKSFVRAGGGQDVRIKRRA